jgi:squalene-hopene/tetraprenyl-beta-curcumene cyclase
VIETTRATVDLVVERAQGWFAREQAVDGYWWAELESNATMDAEYLLLTHFLGARDETIWRGVAQDIRNYQRDDGSWAMYHGAPGDLSTTIECYFALKLAGDSANAPHMARARGFARERGGIAAARTFTRIWLALFGQWSWDDLPAMPPEMMLLPPKAPLSIYRFSSWARGTIVPLLLLMDERPVRAVPESARLDELRLGGSPRRLPGDSTEAAGLPRRPADPERRSIGDLLFFALDRALRAYNRLPVHPLRQKAREAAEQWILSHQEADGSWGGIQPPWVYSLMALHAVGRPLSDPAIRKGLDGMHDRWMLRREDGSLRVQACLSPVWDTGLGLLAMVESGFPASHPVVDRAAKWLLREEIRVPGDWCVRVQGVEPSGWAFEFENDLYPDVDDTAVVVLALHKADALDDATRERAVRWVLAMQSRNGGWAAFDKDNTSRLPALLPFCDFGEVIDPPSADVTGHVVEMLGALGFDRRSPALVRGLRYLYGQQDKEGSWFGRWGVNHIYGVGAVLPALAAAGEDLSALSVRRAVRWLESRQNADGGWGETCASYVDPDLRGRGESAPSQTAWALLGLVAAGRADSPAAHRGVRFLAERQRPDGTWDEDSFTGCGFPGYGVGEERGARVREGRELCAGFMIRYHLYRNCFPLLALGRYRAALHGSLFSATALGDPCDRRSSTSAISMR